MVDLEVAWGRMLLPTSVGCGAAVSHGLSLRMQPVFFALVLGAHELAPCPGRHGWIFVWLSSA